MWIRLRCRMTELMLEDDGMSTVEYAIGTMCQATTRRIAQIQGVRLWTHVTRATIQTTQPGALLASANRGGI